MNDGNDIQIRVGIAGEGVKAALDDIAAGARAAEEAGKGAGDKVEEAGGKAEEGGKRGGRGGKEGAEGLADFHRKAESLVKGIVGEFNPALAHGMDMMFDFAEGATHVTTQLLAWGAAGLIIGGITAAVSAMAEQQERAAKAIERTNDAMRKQRDLSVDAAAEWAKLLSNVGLPSGPADIEAARRAENELNLRGTIDPMARNAVIAQRIGGLSDEQREQFLAGLIAGGGEPVSFKGEVGADRKTVEMVLAAGAGEEARRRLELRRQSDTEFARRQTEPATARDAEREAIDTEIQRFLASRPGIDPSSMSGIDREAIAKFVRNQHLRPVDFQRDMRFGDVFVDQYEDSGFRNTRLVGGNIGLGYLHDIANEIRGAVQRGAASGGGGTQITVEKFEVVTNKYEWKNPNAAPPVQLDVFNGVGGQ